MIRVDCTRAVADGGARPATRATASPLADAGASACAIDIAYGGSCTAGKREDFDHYHEVLSLGRRRAACGCRRGVQLYLQFGTTAVRDYCIERGYLDAFEAVGARDPAAVLRRLRQLRARRRRPTPAR